MKDISDTLRELSAFLDGINRHSASASGRRVPKHLTDAEWMLFGATALVNDVVDWLELNFTPSHADAFRQRFDHLEELAGKANFKAKTKREKVLTVLFGLEKRRLQRHVRNLLRKVEDHSRRRPTGRGRTQTHKRVKRTRARKTTATVEMVKARDLQRKGFSLRTIRDALKQEYGKKAPKSPTTVAEWIKIADAELNPKSRSARARHRLPQDRRGQVDVIGD